MTTSKTGTTSRKAKPVSKAKQALEFARERGATVNSWVELHNAFFGIGGKCVELFPSQTERTAFAKTTEFQEISKILQSLQTRGDAASAVGDASGKFVLRLPRSLHAALSAEAKAEGVSLNQLCVAKLAVQLRAMV